MQQDTQTSANSEQLELLAARELADKLAAQGQYDQAERAYITILMHTPSDATTLRNLGAMKWETADWTGARNCFERWLYHHPSATEPALWLARLAFNQRQFSRSFRIYQSLAECSALDVADGVAFVLCGERIGVEPDCVVNNFPQLTDWRHLSCIRERISLLYLRSGHITPALSWLLRREDSLLDDADVVEEGSSLSTRAREALTSYSLMPKSVLVIDDFLTPQALQSVRNSALSHANWRRSSSGHEAVADLSDGLVSATLLRAAHEVRTMLAIARPELAVSAIWHYRYFGNDVPPVPHADDGDISVNLWLTPQEYCLDNTGGGLTVFDAVAPQSYFSADSKQQARLLAQDIVGASNGTAVPYRFNRAVVFHGRSIHQTQPYRFGHSPEARRMNLTFLYD
ncbi:tetratricopeptide repeat protein [Hydrogenophaga luteola]|uniref:Tetratricopeptide repeat protein n=1 Tax=Hydrogenophaga luteola TaxID=1591122 RepID=A0ABV7WAQ9_9BURK